MATYINSDGKDLYLYGVNSTIFSSNDGSYPCILTGDTYYNVATNFKVGTTVIKALNPESISLSAWGNSGTGSDLYIGFNTGTVANGLASTGASIRLCSSSSNVWSGTPEHSLTFSGNGWYYTNGELTASSYYYIRVLTSIGSYTSGDAIRPCNGSTNATGGSCCSSSSLTCGCSDSNNSCSSGSSSLNCSCSSTANGCSSSNSYDCGCSSASATGGCVSEDTEILTKDGYKFAKDITSDDILLSYKDGKLIENPSTTIFVQKDHSKIFRIVFEDNSILFITEKHPILCDDNVFRTPLELNETVYVSSISGPKKVRKINTFTNNGNVYNFLVNADNFIANDIILSCENIKLEEDELWFISNDNVMVDPNFNKDQGGGWDGIN